MEAEEIQKKILSAKESVRRLTEERDKLMDEILPINLRLEKIKTDLDYWTRRIEKQSKRFLEITGVKHG